MIDSLIGWVPVNIVEAVPVTDSRIGFVVVTFDEPDPPPGPGLRVYTAQGLQPATVLTWTANGWT